MKARHKEESLGEDPSLLCFTSHSWLLASQRLIDTVSDYCRRQSSWRLRQINHKIVTSLPLLVFIPLCNVTADPVIKR